MAITVIEGNGGDEGPLLSYRSLTVAFLAATPAEKGHTLEAGHIHAFEELCGGKRSAGRT